MLGNVILMMEKKSVYSFDFELDNVSTVYGSQKVIAVSPLGHRQVPT